MNQLNPMRIVNNDNVVTYENNKLILKYGVKLSDVIAELPNGIIDKRVAGIGGTTLEILALRNSIIVEPLKNIAASKAVKHNALYVGSDTEICKRPSDEEITEYLKRDGYKKILVVADSIPRLLKLMPASVYKDYFFLLDEIDMFQTESDYRNSLEKCVDYYIKFDNKAMISATVREFSNPKLQEEPLTVIKYDNKISKNIRVIKTNDEKQTIVKYIRGQKETILIAVNSVTLAKEVIDTLDEKIQKECAILCGDGSKENAEKYYNVIKEEKLPRRINFMTSAYFAGIDISDKYHSLTVSTTSYRNCLLSPEALHQIVGRGRNGLLSETFIISIREKNANVDLSSLKGKMISKAKDLIEGTKCIHHLLREKNKGISYEKIKEAILSTSDEHIQLVRQDMDDDFVPAYFNIDCEYEKQKTSYLYLNYEIKRRLEDMNYIVVSNKENYDVEETENSLKGQNRIVLRNKMLGEIIDILKTDGDILELYKNSKGDKRVFMEQYQNLYKYLDKNTAIKMLYELNYDKRDARSYKGYMLALEFHSQGNDSFFKKNVLARFPIGTQWSSKQIQEQLNSLFKTAKIDMTLKTSNEAVYHLKKYFKAERIYNEKNKQRTQYYKIEGLNPYDIILRQGWNKSLN